MISRRQISRAVRFARPVLRQLGNENAAAAERQMLKEYAAVAPSVPRLGAPMSRMTLSLAVDVLVLYRSLPTELSKDAKLELISQFVARWMEGQFETRVARWVYAHRGPHLLFRRWWFWCANHLDGPQGWRFRFRRDDPSLLYAVDVTRCGIVLFLAGQGASELAPLICRGDYQITKYLPPGVTFARTQVISEGAPFCDFRYPITPKPKARTGHW